MADPVAPTPIPDWPTAPTPLDPPELFDSRAFAQAAALQPQTTATNAANANTFNNATSAYEDAAAALTSRNEASGFRNEAEGFKNTAGAAASAAQGFRNEASGFRDDADASADAAAVSAAQAAASAGAGFTATSTTSMTPGLGVMNFTTQTNKAFGAGQYVVLVSAGAPTARMSGYVQSYNAATGAMSVDFDAFGGTGAHADWGIAVSLPNESGGMTTQRISANTVATAGVYYVATVAGITLTVNAGFTKDKTLAGKNISGGVCFINWTTNTVSGDTPESPMRWPIDAKFETIYDGSTFA